MELPTRVTRGSHTRVPLLMRPLWQVSQVSLRSPSGPGRRASDSDLVTHLEDSLTLTSAMVVPQSAAYPTINQLIGMTLHAAPAPTMEAARPGPSPQEHFIHLLLEAERRHRDTLQRAIHAETQVQRLRELFRQWQLQLQQQHAQQLQKLMDQEVQQRQVQRQMQSLYNALLQQQRQHLQVRKKVDEMAAFQQLHAFTQQQQLGQVQLELFGLDRGQRAERRSRQALQRQVAQSRRWRRPSPTPPAAPTAPKDVCNQDDCCPCEFPQECPFNPCIPDDCCSTEIPDGPEATSCFLRDIRLGFVLPPSCIECESHCKGPRGKRQRTRHDSQTECGYEADDEASLVSVVTSNSSSAFVQERRQLLQEVRSLENTKLEPRYKEVWKPLRCFHCGKLDHLATLCPNLPTTVL